MTEPARLVSSPNCDETSAPSARGNLARFKSTPHLPVGRANFLSRGSEKTSLLSMSGPLPRATVRKMGVTAGRVRHPFSGFQSTDDPAGRNPDTLKAVVMTETGLAFAEAAPLALPKIQVRHCSSHAVLQSECLQHPPCAKENTQC